MPFRHVIKPAKLSFCTSCDEAIGLYRYGSVRPYWAHVDQSLLASDPHPITLTRRAKFRTWLARL